MKLFFIRVVILDRNYLVFSWEIVFLLLNCWYISWLYWIFVFVLVLIIFLIYNLRSKNFLKCDGVVILI